MKNITYYFTERYEIRNDEDPYYGIIAPIDLYNLHCLCGYLQLVRHQLPRLTIFDDLLCTPEITHIIEAFYGYQQVVVPYDHNNPAFIELDLYLNWRNYAGFQLKTVAIEELTRFTVESAPMKMLKILFELFSKKLINTNDHLPNISDDETIDDEFIIRFLGMPSNEFYQQEKRKQERWIEKTTQAQMQVETVIQGKSIQKSWGWKNIVNTSIKDLDVTIAGYPDD